jgi:hypothetical protein
MKNDARHKYGQNVSNVIYTRTFKKSVFSPLYTTGFLNFLLEELCSVLCDAVTPCYIYLVYSVLTSVLGRR